jgi:hypothetical protein
MGHKGAGKSIRGATKRVQLKKVLSPTSALQSSVDHDAQRSEVAIDGLVVLVDVATILYKLF